MLLTNTTTGIALYLNVVGLFAKVGVAFCFYRTFRKYCESELLFLACVFFMAVNAKNSVILEFSNMMIYFSILLCCALFAYLQRQTAIHLLIWAAVFFCLEVLSYPSAIVIFPLILMLLYRYATVRMRDIVLFSGICGVFGGLFFLFLFFQVKMTVVDESAWQVFWKCFHYTVKEDGSHQLGNFSRIGDSHIRDVKYMTVLYAASTIISILVTEFMKFVKQRKVLSYEKEISREGWNKKEYCIEFFLLPCWHRIFCMRFWMWAKMRG